MPAPARSRLISAFLDSSVIIAAVLSPRGGSFRLCREAASGRLKLVSNRYVHDEVERALRKKYPHTLPRFRELLRWGKFGIRRNPPAAHVERYAVYLPPEDAPILAGAIGAGANFLITLDRDFMTEKVRRAELPITIAAPKEFFQLHWN